MRRKLISDPARLAEMNALAELMSRACSNAERDRILENWAQYIQENVEQRPDRDISPELEELLLEWPK
ncbi:MAG: hypothetical protein LBD99_06255 [Candidatus Margulisbacteria bacterium]|jgi:hypothetical protein|nr:hypothetical protein [Candidatus Margulisiibacteriota bacterium]